jgi:5-formyltetrahydrofolate cyclo-ligase
VTKAELRREARARLAAIDRAGRDSASLEIARRVWEVEAVACARTLLLFAGRPDEVETDPIAEEARRRGIRVAYPLCDAATGCLTLHSPEGALVPGAYGIREPDPASSVLLETGAIDAVLVPGLAWDRAGGRLGRGAGYFDRLFGDAEWRGFRCGLFFAAQEVPAVPLDPWDAHLDAVVTEREVWRRG